MGGGPTGRTFRPNVAAMTSPAAWYQARTAKTRTTQPPALVTPVMLAPAPIDSRKS